MRARIPGVELSDYTTETGESAHGRPIRHGGLMSSFSARLRIAGESRILLGVLVDVTDETITATFADSEVASWSLDEVDISYLSDGFHISAAGEETVIGVTEPRRFASALGFGSGRSDTGVAPRRNPRRHQGQRVLRRPLFAAAGGTGH
jgi:hypothetical protein